MRFAIIVALVCFAAAAFGAPATESPRYQGGGRIWTPWPDPDIEVKWVQTPVPYPYGNALASQDDQVYPFFAQVADDWLCDETGLIVAVEWWGTYWNPGPPPPPGYFFMIEFWSDDGEPYPESSPLDLLYQEPCFIFFEDYDVDYEQYHYFQYLDFPFQQFAGNKYWLSIYAVFPYPPQFGWCIGEPPWGDPANFKSDFFGYPEWTPSQYVWGELYDMAFALYKPAPNNPVEDTSWGSIKAMFR
jgi:hypothetical protein